MKFQAILLDDDFFVGREYVEALNDSHLFQATQAQDVKELLSLVNEKEFDVAIIDIRMMDDGHLFDESETALGYRTGVALYYRLRDMRPGMHVAALTNDKHPEIINIFTDDEAVAYFDKEIYRSINFPGALYTLLKGCLGNDIIQVKKRRFKIGFSFPGEHRVVVEQIVTCLLKKFKRDEILYDKFYADEFSRLNLDTYLQTLYCDECDLVIVVRCSKYAEKRWCGIEWRAIRDEFLNKEERLMFIKANDGPVPGLYSTDGYISMAEYSIEEIAGFISSRWEQIQ